MKVVYITGLGRSGSTLLDVLLNAHSGMVGVGEVHKLRKFARLERSGRPGSLDRIGNSCACGAPTVWDCPFWTRVNAELVSASHGGLAALDLEARDPADFRRDNARLFAAAGRASGTAYVVDSSKRVSRLRRLLAHPELEVVPVHILRDPRGRSNSIRRRNGRLFGPAVQFSYRSLRLFRLLFNRPHWVIRYERLAASPEWEMRPLMDFLGLPLEDGQIRNWADRDNHNLAGNRVRTARDSAIVPDRSWETELDPLAKAGIGLVSAPGRAANRWKERRWRTAPS
ncbi:sulfotransferase [Thiohalorhabdus sp. Cl-TMA]|uniref:Sulfotransferase n=1 Tax=Thiohalorhabdus methylotrophus TaxID=3242694 RepID=A0ABV4TT17_9GAMM